MSMSDRADTLLLYAPVPLYVGADGGFLLEDQACNGLRLWSENFGKVIVMHPVEHGPAPATWIPVAQAGIDPQKVELLPLPTAWRPDRFFRALGPTRQRIREAIGRAHYLSFAIGGLFGDWGSVACWEAHRMGRPFAIWTDRVESEVVRIEAREGRNAKVRLRASIYHPLMAALERFLIRRATVGLFHGAETYATYAPYARQSELVHDIHLKAEDRIGSEELQRKIDEVRSGAPLKICYLGRADAMKGPLDWIEVMRGLKEQGIAFQARWLGQGALWDEMKQLVDRYGLADHVELPGFIRDRQLILQALRSAHLFVFCHKTPESPRNLIESLVSGAPIVGYDGAFARDLIGVHHGGQLTAINDTGQLTEAVAVLSRDRERLEQMIRRAALDGEAFNDEQVFRHRSEVIRRHLS